MTRAQLVRSRYAALVALAVARSRLATSMTVGNLSAVREAKADLAAIDAQLRDPVALAAYKQAKTLIGVMEQGGNNAGAKVSEIIRANGGTGPEPWCGDFVAYCYRLAGSTKVTRAWASVFWLGQLTGLVKTDNPVIGDIVRYKFDHTGLFAHWANSFGKVVPKSQATHILAVEGNTGPSGAVSDSKTGGDGVYMKLRDRSLVQDFRHVR